MYKPRTNYTPEELHSATIADLEADIAFSMRRAIEDPSVADAELTYAEWCRQ
jgi:hypothetical protein